MVEVLRWIGLARPLFIDACGDVGRKLGLEKRVNLVAGRMKPVCILFSGPWHSTAALSFHMCVPGAIQDIGMCPAGPLKSAQEELVPRGKRCDGLTAVLTCIWVSGGVT